MNVTTGVFNSISKAEDAYNALIKAGVDPDKIGVVVCDAEKGKKLGSDLRRDFKRDEMPKTVVDRGAIYCRFSQPYIDTLRQSSMPSDAVDWYQHHLDRGDILTVIVTGEGMSFVDHIIHENGGILYPGTFMDEHPAATTDKIFVPIIEEELVVEKATHELGEVDISSESTSRTVEVPTTVMHEEVRVERHQLDRPMSVEEYKTKVHTEAGVVRMPVVEEELRVMKKPVIREEMVITRVPITESRTVREKLQHTEPHVETHGDVHVEQMTEEEKKRRPAA